MMFDMILFICSVIFDQNKIFSEEILFRNYISGCNSNSFLFLTDKNQKQKFGLIGNITNFDFF